MTDSESNLISGLAAEIDPLMWRILASKEVSLTRDLVHEVMWHCMEQPYREHLRDLSTLYVIWAELDDILDGWPVDYGQNTETIAMCEFRRAAKEWLDIPRTEVGIRDYVDRWRTRLADGTWN